MLILRKYIHDPTFTGGRRSMPVVALRAVMYEIGLDPAGGVTGMDTVIIGDPLELESALAERPDGDGETYLFVIVAQTGPAEYTLIDAVYSRPDAEREHVTIPDALKNACVKDAPVYFAIADDDAEAVLALSLAPDYPERYNYVR